MKRPSYIVNTVTPEFVFFNKDIVGTRNKSKIDQNIQVIDINGGGENREKVEF